ncbi:hypothetical protein N0V93_007855 [Gnomoniopsis smithogilvyi]|uniref:DUF1993 domain-containing protein n=1 Tax=Gnomoniopsis smithogilvyi TaxID=1191159 RepID=A0A9W8YLK5_9PEZI|nr:hypothetical protein N0V93_007855 [Gnomoniopsis smithogilvyi]
MTGYSLYNTYLVQWSAALTALDAILKKAEAHAKDNGIDVDVQYASAKIHEDMHPLTFQIHIVTSVITMPLNLLLGNAPQWEGDLKTFADLHARVKSAQDYITSLKPEDIDGKEDTVVKAPGPLASSYPDGLSAKAMCENFAIPNLYFHLVTAYDILRKEGVPLGKSDYLNPFLPKKN